MKIILTVLLAGLVFGIFWGLDEVIKMYGEEQSVCTCLEFLGDSRDCPLHGSLYVH